MVQWWERSLPTNAARQVQTWRQCYSGLSLFLALSFASRGFLQVLAHVHEGGGNMYSLSSSKINTSKFQFDVEECIFVKGFLEILSTLWEIELQIKLHITKETQQKPL